MASACAGSWNVGGAEDAIGMILPNVPRNIAGTYHRPHESERVTLLARDHTNIFQTGLHRRCLEHQSAHRLQVLTQPFESRPHRVGHGRRKIEGNAARPNEPASKATPRQSHEEAQALAPHAAKESGGRLVGHVPGDRAEVADMIDQSLELERDAANTLCAR